MKSERVTTALRVRPLSAAESGTGSISVVSPSYRDPNSIGISHPSALLFKDGQVSPYVQQPERMFNYDHIFWSASRFDEGFCSQQDVFERIGLPLVESCLLGVNSSLFAYGQTGSGKTYTVMGATDLRNEDDLGLIPRICRHLIEEIRARDSVARRTSSADSPEETILSSTLDVSFVEIYNERVYDLLSGDIKVPCKVRSDSVSGAYVENLTRVEVRAYSEALTVLRAGNRIREVAVTAMNSRSSRSHTIFTIYLTQKMKLLVEFERSSKICLVDLAGSERLRSTSASGQRLKEAVNINKSLSVLGDVISSLSEASSKDGTRSNSKSPFIPYRNSVLTWLLKDSLGGNCRPTMLATISPSGSVYDESLSTMKYLERAKLIENRVAVNDNYFSNPHVAMLQSALTESVKRYSNLLEAYRSLERQMESAAKKKGRQSAEDEEDNNVLIHEMTNYITNLENELGVIRMSMDSNAVDDVRRAATSEDLSSELGSAAGFTPIKTSQPAIDASELISDLRQALDKIISSSQRDDDVEASKSDAMDVIKSIVESHVSNSRDIMDTLSPGYPAADLGFSAAITQSSALTSNNADDDRIANASVDSDLNSSINNEASLLDDLSGIPSPPTDEAVSAEQINAAMSESQNILRTELRETLKALSQLRGYSRDALAAMRISDELARSPSKRSADAEEIESLQSTNLTEPSQETSSKTARDCKGAESQTADMSLSSTAKPSDVSLLEERVKSQEEALAQLRAEHAELASQLRTALTQKPAAEVAPQQASIPTVNTDIVTDRADHDVDNFSSTTPPDRIAEAKSTLRSTPPSKLSQGRRHSVVFGRSYSLSSPSSVPSPKGSHSYQYRSALSRSGSIDLYDGFDSHATPSSRSSTGSPRASIRRVIGKDNVVFKDVQFPARLRRHCEQLYGRNFELLQQHDWSSFRIVSPRNTHKEAFDIHSEEGECQVDHNDIALGTHNSNFVVEELMGNAGSGVAPRKKRFWMIFGCMAPNV